MRPLLFVHVSKAANVQNASGGTMAGQKEGKAERTDQSNVKAVAEEIRRAVRQATLDAMEEEQARPNHSLHKDHTRKISILMKWSLLLKC